MQLRTLLGAVAALAMTALAVLGLATPALAVYGPQSGSANVSATSVTNGGSVTASGDRFCPGSTVTVTVTQGGGTYITTTATASSAGTVSVRVKLTQTGNNTITLTGQQSNCSGSRVLTAKVHVLGVKFGNGAAAGAGQGSGLPGTGGVNFTPLWAGLGLLAAGALLVTGAQRRRRILI